LKTILHIVGNRPQFIKLAVLYKELSTAGIPQKIIHTGQHSSAEMSDIFFSELSIPEVDKFLSIESNGDADVFVAKASNLLQEYFKTIDNTIAFVYGDTNTTLAAAIAAKRVGIPLFHFEAGVRTGDMAMPEEINRILTDRLADTNYCCTEKNHSAMIAEGYSTAIKSEVLLSGDLMYDAFLKIPVSEKNIIDEKEYVAVTIHRAANILSKENLSEIINGLNKIHKSIPVVMPIHPHTKKRMDEHGLIPEFIGLAPLGYSTMKKLLSDCSYIITDSGGAAREAFFSKKRSLTVMNNPFWPEIVEAGCSIKTSANAEGLYNSFLKLGSLKPDFETRIFGNGNASQIIREDILKYND
jgi:UDP-GlcNAc3NAcA epimerase